MFAELLELVESGAPTPIVTRAISGLEKTSDGPRSLGSHTATEALGAELGPRTATAISRYLHDRRDQEARQLYKLARHLDIPFRLRDVGLLIQTSHRTSPNMRFWPEQLSSHLIGLLDSSWGAEVEENQVLLRRCADFLSEELIKRYEYSQVIRLCEALTKKDVAPAKPFRVQVFRAVFRQRDTQRGLKSSRPIDEVTPILSRLVHAFSSTRGADLVPEISGLLLKEMADIFRRVREPDARGKLHVARTWIGHSRLLARRREGGSGASPDPIVSFEAVSASLGMLEHVQDVLRRTDAGRTVQIAIMRQVQDLLREELDVLIVPLHTTDDDATSTSTEDGTARLKLLVRHNLVLGHIRAALKPLKEMEALHRAARFDRNDIQANKTLRSTYMLIANAALQDYYDPDTSPLRSRDVMLEVLAESHHLILKPYHTHATARFSQLWRKALVHLCHNSHTNYTNPLLWGGCQATPTEYIAFMTTFVDVLKRARITGAMRREIRGAVWLPSIVRELAVHAGLTDDDMEPDRFIVACESIGIPPLSPEDAEKLVERIKSVRWKSELNELFRLWEVAHAAGKRKNGGHQSG